MTDRKLNMDPNKIKNHLEEIKREVEKREETTEDEILETHKINDSENPEGDYKDHGFYIKDSKYFTKSMDKKNNVSEIEISNFVMRSLYNLTNGTNNSSRLIIIQRKPRKNGSIPEKWLIEVKSSELKQEAFETILKSHGCTFLGTNYILKKILAYLMDEEDTAKIISLLGWNEEFQFYAFADSLLTLRGELKNIDNMGVIKHDGKIYYLPAYGLANQTNEDFTNDKTFKFRPGNIDFSKWASLLYQASGKNAIPGMLYAIMAAYRDIIFRQLNFFPFLYLFGEKGTGKTSFINPMLLLYRSDSTGTPLNNATIVALNRLVSSWCNGIFYFKEYTTDTDSMAEDFILSGYDGAGRETGVKSNDTKTKKFPIRSGIIFDGNSLPRKSNIMSRMILLTFEKTTFSDNQKQAFEKLRDYSQYGFGNVLREILTLRTTILKHLKPGFSKSKDIVNSTILHSDQYKSMQNADERILQHTYLLYTIYQISKEHLSFPFADEDVLDALLHIGDNMMGMLLQTDSVTVFWESLAYNINKDQIHELNLGLSGQPSNKKIAVYWMKDSETESPLLLIKFQQLYPYYVRYCKDNGIRYLDKNSMLSILTSENNRSFIPSPQKSRVKAHRVKYFDSCYIFRAEKIADSEKTYQINGVEITL